VIIVLIGAVISALLVGFFAGLLSFKVKDRWCPHCGATTSDLARQHAGPAR
jgi:NADH pyrophosphatase NudC (nudix superfamily)